MTETPVAGRGRHRRPRPRKVLFAVGGLALAAGALSLVRMAPESGSGGLGTAEAEPRQHPGLGATWSDNTAATVEAVPRSSRSASSVLGGVSATPTAGASVLPLPAQATSPGDPGDPRDPTAATTPGTTTVPKAPNAPTATPTYRPPATTAPAPGPTRAPGRTTPPPAPRPGHPGGDGNGPGLCLPVVGLCVGALTGEND